jgi:hypothetical protein
MDSETVWLMAQDRKINKKPYGYIYYGANSVVNAFHAMTGATGSGVLYGMTYLNNTLIIPVTGYYVVNCQLSFGLSVACVISPTMFSNGSAISVGSSYMTSGLGLAVTGIYSGGLTAGQTIQLGAWVSTSTAQSISGFMEIVCLGGF